MRILYRLGWVLLGVAFLGGGAEMAARMVKGGGGLFLGTYDVWYALWPGSLVTFEIRMERLFPAWLWDPVLRSVLALPPWALFGIPGVLLAWFKHPHRGLALDPEMEESVFLFDELARRAIEEGYTDSESGDDRLPSHAIAGDFDPGLDTIGRDAEDFDPADLLTESGDQPDRPA